MDDKYIELLLRRCVDLDSSKILFINYNLEIQDFINKLIKRAYELGIEDVYLDKDNPLEIHDYLLNHNVDEIKESDYFDKSIWDTYAAKGANFLIFETETPKLMDDISAEKIAVMTKRRQNSRLLYRKMVEHCELSWCIAAYPGVEWAKYIFDGDVDSYSKLKEAIYKICMIDQGDPIASIDKHLNKTEKIMNYLNELGLKKLHYTNDKGTDFSVWLPSNYLFSSAKDRNVIVNMPSYEVFTSPIYNKTEGIVYSSKPLNYNGLIIDDFWLKFEGGKVIDFDAKIGKEALKEIINADDNSCYLGECALVESSSPIASLGITFGTTLIDENASCHLALGMGFAECIKDGLEFSDDELLKHGINVSKTHIDFMIGTNDLTIMGTNSDNKEIPIFVDGNFASNILEVCE